jgi:NSS family neurotransmitter:Na+ symporter
MIKRDKWSSQIGFLLAAIGSAIGLGNIWRFSYMAYENGGGAFLVPYFVALVTAGIPLMILEYGLGHKKHGSSALSFAKVGRRYEWLGWWMPIFVMFGIMFYYSVIIGWCTNYAIYSLNLKWGTNTENFFLHQYLGLSSGVGELGGIRPNILWSTALIWLIMWLICYREVAHGIERACKLFMPLLFVLTLILIIWGCTLEGAALGLKWYLKPDWAKIANWKVWVAAYGQIFFTLSLGFGIMVTYASYLPKKSDLVQNAVITSVTNCLYSFFAGFAVFSVLGYMAQAKGLPIDKVVKSGPTLAFVVYPEAISRLPFLNSLFGLIFFVTLVIAGLSSGISIIEAMSSSLIDKFNLPRGRTVSILCIVGFLGSLLFATQGGLYLLDIVDHFLNQYGLVLAGLLECIIVGWIMRARVLRHHINSISKWRINKLWDFFVKFAIPALLLVMVINELLGEFVEPYYGGYGSTFILLVGVGWVVVTLVLAVVVSRYPWQPEKLKYEHKPEEDQLMV